MLRRLYPAALLLAAPLAMASAPPVAPERIGLTPDAEARWVPFDLTPGNQIRFAVQIDGHAATAILDTGVSVSVLSRQWAERHAMPILPGTHALGIGGRVTVDWIAGRSLALGGLRRSGGRLGVVDLPASVTGGAHPADALIGRDMLDRYALDIDFAARRFRLLPSGRLPFAGESAPLATLPRQHLYVSEMRIGDVRVRPMIVDTGDGATVTVSQDAWRSLDIHRPAATTTISYGVSGPVTTELAVLPSVEIGQATLRQAEARVEPTNGFSAQVGAAGRIGLGFLRHYRVLLDPGAGRMVLAPGPDGGTPAPQSTSGLLFAVDSDRLRILHVMRGGPAAATGWKAGDQICSIDGATVDSGYPRLPIAHWSVGSPGRVVTLGMCGGGVRSLTLRRFY